MLKELVKFLYSHRQNKIIKAIENSTAGKILKIYLQYRFTQRNLHDRPETPIKSYYNLNSDRKNILLIHLPFPENERHKKIIPVGLAYIASYCHEKLPELNFAILDGQINFFSIDEIIDEILPYKWFLIGLSYQTVQAEKAWLLSKSLKKHFPETFIVHGGIHPTVCPEEAVDYTDFVVVHEGEEIFKKLLETLIEGKGDFLHIKGLVYKKDGEIINTGFYNFIEDLDTLPMPAFELLPVEKYKMPLHITGEERLPVIGSRGCPFACSYCVSPLMWKKRVRWRNPRLVVEEMQYLKETYGVCAFHFWDDNLTLNREYIEGLCKELIEKKLNISWIALDRAELINKNKDILPELKKAGCIGIEIGIESANPDTFTHISKNQSLEETRNAINNIKESGIAPLYTYMAFNPGESINGYYMQKEFLDDIHKGLPWYNFFHPIPFPVYVGQCSTPYPKTKFRENVSEKGILLLEDPEYLYHHPINFLPHSLLEDIPVRNIDKLSKNELYICLFVIKQSIWSYFKKSEPLRDTGKKLMLLKDYTEKFFSECNGWLTINQLAVRLHDEYGITMNRSYRYSAMLSYIMGQMGWIRSAINQRNAVIKPKFIKLPLEFVWEIGWLLSKGRK